MIDLVPFNTMLEAVARVKYPTAVIGSLSDSEREEFAVLIEDALRDALDIFWPRLTLAEQRTPVSGLIATEQTGETKIGMVEGVYRTDPTLGRAVRIAHRIVPDGVQIGRSYGDVWIRFMEPKARFSAEVYDGGTAYNSGSVVLDATDGNCYLARAATLGSVPSEHPEEWVLQPIPLFLKRYIRLVARHELLSEGDGKWSALRDAENELDKLCLSEFDQQGQSSVAEVWCG